MPTRARTTKSKATAEEENVLETLAVQAEDQSVRAETWADTAKRNEYATRDRMAKSFMRWYFGLLTLIMIGIPFYNLVARVVTGGDGYKVALLDIIQGYSSIVGPLFGFVIAYYFKNKNE